MASMVQRLKRLITGNKMGKSINQLEVEAMEPWTIFVTNAEKGPLEQETVDCLRKLLGTDAYNNVVSLPITDY